MKKETFHLPHGSYARLFGYLAGLQLLIAGIATAVGAARQNFITTLVISVLATFTGGIFLLLSAFWNKKPQLAKRISDLFRNRYGHIIPFFLIFALTGFLFIIKPDRNALLSLSPLLICLWVTGIEMLVIFPAIFQDNPNRLTEHRKKLAVIGLLLAYGIALIPARIPALLSGIPWDTPFEFIFVTLILPFAFIVGGRFFSNWIVLLVLGFLMILKVILMISLPQSGLGVRAYMSENTLRSGSWEKSYDMLINPSYTQLMQMPYTNTREFPIEWINRPGFDRNKFSVTIEISGAGYLREDERLAIIVKGARQAQIEIVNPLTQNMVSAVLVEDVKQLDHDLYQKIRQIKEFTLKGTLTFKRFREYQIHPVILFQNGTVKSAFAPARLWISAEAWGYSHAQLIMLSNLLNVIGFALAGIVVLSLLAGSLDLYRAGDISLTDFYLSLTALPIFYVAGQMQKPNMNILILSITCILAAAKVVELIIHKPRQFSGKDILFSVGLSFLLMFLALDIDSLRKVTIFPQGQDGLEYQIHARNIFVNGDFLLADSPPRAYKILFPYLAGLLHVLFGQSSSSQLFLSAWFALLSSVIMVYVMEYYRVAPSIAFIAAVLFPLILCLPSSYIFYFRFGLIEPAAIFCLLSAAYFGIHRQIPFMFISGMLTVLFRLDYLGAVFAVVFLTVSPIKGTASIAWRQFMDWIKSRWKLLTVYALALCMSPLLIILGYFFFTPNYVLNMSDTRQQSVASMLEGIFLVIVGGDMQDLRTKFLRNPAEILLIVIPLALGFMIAIASLGYRKGWFENIDLRWALLTVSILPAYLFVRPTGYAPRFSLPMLPFDLVILGLLIHTIHQKDAKYYSAIETRVEQ